MTTVAPGTVVLDGVTLDDGDALFPLQGSLDIQDAIDRESTCDLTVIDIQAANHYREGNPVLVYDGNNALAYAGWLTDVKEKLDSGWSEAEIPALRHTLQATDNHYLANKRDVGASYESVTAGDIFQDIIDTVLVDEGVYSVRNLLSANQSSIETDTTGFGMNTGTLTRDTTQHWQGSASLKLVTTTSGDKFISVNGADSFGAFTNCWAVTPGKAYTFSAYAKSDGTAAVTLRIIEVNVSGAVLRDLTLSPSSLATAFTRLAMVYTAGANAAGVLLRIQQSGTPSGSIWVDGLMWEPRPLGAADATLRGPGAWELGGTSTVQAGPNVTKFVSGYAKASECYDALAQRANFWWRIDNERRAWFADRATITAPWTFDGTQDAGDGGTTVEVEHTSPNYRNSQYVGGGTAQTDTQVETRIGDGTNTTFTMGYPLAQTPTVEVKIGAGSFTAKTVGINGLDAPGTKDWYWNAGKNEIVQDSGGVKLTSADTLRVTYVGSFAFIARARNDAEIAAQAAREGGTTSGIVDDFESDATIDSAALAFEIGNSYLARYATSGDILTFQTRESGLAPGQLLSVDLPIHGLPAGTQMLITEVDIKDPGGFDLIYSVKAISGPVDSTWIEFFKVLTAKRLENQDAINLGSGSSLIIAESGSVTWTWTVTGSGTVITYDLPSPTLYPSPSRYPGSAGTPTSITWNKTNAGKNAIRDALSGAASAPILKSPTGYLAWGTGTQGTPASATQLANEVGRKQITSNVNGASVVEEIITAFIGTTDSPGAAITEVAFFATASAAANSGVMMLYGLYSHSHTDLESIQIVADSTVS